MESFIRLIRGAIGVLVVSITVVGIGAPPGFGQTSQIRTDADTLAAVVDYVDGQRLELGIPGMAVAVVVGDEVVLVKGLGETSDGGPVTADTVFLINSMSKSITALALMQLVDAGSVDLDAPVSTYVPELSPGGDEVTVRDVMHHRSGVDDQSIPPAAETELAANVAHWESRFRTNADYAYSNANYDLLALIVERVSGVPFADYIEENIFGPLDMERSAVSTARADSLRPTQGHYPWLFAGYRPTAMAVDQGQAGSAAMYSSADDLANYVAAQMSGGVYGDERLVSSEGLAILHEVRPFDDEVAYGYGGGLVVEPANSFDTPAAMAGFPTVSHDGASPTFRSVMWMTLGPDVGMVMLGNGNDVTDESWIGQLAYGTRLILSGETPIEVTDRADFLTRSSKMLYLGLVLLQAGLLIAVLPAMRRLRRGSRPGTAGWVVLGAATVVDIAAAFLVFIVTPAVADAPLSEVMALPDYRILIWAIIILIGWGVVRTGLAAWWMMRSRRAERAPAAATA